LIDHVSKEKALKLIDLENNMIEKEKTTTALTAERLRFARALINENLFIGQSKEFMNQLRNKYIPVK
jgi:hypothetical protein